MIQNETKSETFNVLANQKEFKDFSIVEHMTYFKISDPKTPRVQEAPWGFPLLDMAFYAHHNQTHLNVMILEAISPLDYTYPLRLRPFGKYWLPAPKDPVSFLGAARWYNLTENCVRGNWNHRIDRLQNKDTISCSELKDYYPMVNRGENSAILNGQTVEIESINYFNKTKIHLLYYDNVIPITIKIEL